MIDSILNKANKILRLFKKDKNKFNLLIAGCPCGAGNIGDDAILAGILKIVRSIESKKELYIKVTSWNPNITEKMFETYNISAIFSESGRGLYWDMAWADAVIIGGGTLVDDSYDGLSFPIRHTLRFFKAASHLRKKVLVCAIGANKLSGNEAKKLVRKYYSRAQWVTTRDEESKNVLEGLGIKNVRVVRDPAFLIDPQDASLSQKDLLARGIDCAKKKGLIIGVSVMNENTRKIHSYKQEVAKACDQIIEEFNAQIVFVAHECRPGMDSLAIQETMGYMKNAASILSVEYYHPQRMLGMIQQFDLTIGMRMHFMILSAVANVPFVAISRIDKVNNFMKMFGLNPSATVTDAQHKYIVDDVRRILKNYSDSKNKLREHAAGVKAKAMEIRPFLEQLIQQ